MFTNVCIYEGKHNRVGEIDVLVLFSNRAIVLQAKSKKLTIAARKGNDNILKDDFKKAVQSAYNQAHQCSMYLLDTDCNLVDGQGNPVVLDQKPKEIYPVCILSDHYPSLSFQARQFLQYKTSEVIQAPFVMDIFLLDVMTEMLSNPIYLLSYVNRRVNYAERLSSNHELTILSYHLKQNLWLDQSLDLVQIGDDVAADLDLAMIVRRTNVPGPATPPGILTNYQNTHFGGILDQLIVSDQPEVIDITFLLLKLGSESIEFLNAGLEAMYSGGHTDISLAFKHINSGLTIHCNDDLLEAASYKLGQHCELRKYVEHSHYWFGLCISRSNHAIRLGVVMDSPWSYSAKLAQETRSMKRSPSHIL